MNETLHEIFGPRPALGLSGSIGLILLIAFLISKRDALSWIWINFWYSFPLIGRIARMSGDINKDATHPNWYKSERTLCADYRRFVRLRDEYDFMQKQTYLRKADDLGRSPMPGWVWALTAMLVIVEAFGFSYVLAGYTLPGASENMQQIGALGIAFLVAVILVAFTHFSGHELYVSGKIKLARLVWVQDGRVNKLQTRAVSLAEAQEADDEHPPYTQMINRIGSNQVSYKFTIATVIVVVLVAVGATYVRGQVLEKELSNMTLGQSAPSTSVFGTIKSDLPPDIAAAKKITDDKVISDLQSTDRKGGWGTFIVLAVIFVFLQVLGIIFGYKWGFAGKQSEAAWVAVGRGKYNSYAEIRDDYQNVSDTAQGKLEELQQKMMDRNAIGGTEGVHTRRSFGEFMLEVEQEMLAQAHRRHDLNRQHDAMRRAATGAQDVATAAPPTIAPPALSADDLAQAFASNPDLLKHLQATLNKPTVS